MGVFKEEIRFLEELESRQSRVWGDSADSGIARSDLSDGELAMLRSTIQNLLELPGSSIYWRADKPSIQRHYRLVIMWSRSDNNYFDASQIDVLYYKGRDKEFFTITTGHAYTDENGTIQTGIWN